MRISNFHVIRPRYNVPQEDALEWIAWAHAEAEKKKQTDSSFSHESFYEGLRTLVLKIGMGKEKIQHRGVHMRDLQHRDLPEMDIFRLHENPEGMNAKIRSEFYDLEVGRIFEQFYDNTPLSPSHMIHVSCTGYAAPSPAQRLIASKGWGQDTIATHAYHMGCYAAIVALRMASGFLHSCKSIDIVHTELCALYMNPTYHAPEQLVIQSLFADGFIKYTLSNEGTGLEILALHEETIPDTADKMTWTCEDWGFRMTVSRDVPHIVTKNVGDFVKRLSAKAGLSDLQDAVFAIHPGGPKIIEQVAIALELKDTQIQHSKKILRDCGNMSSATLPHIWNEIDKDDAIKAGTIIVSLAFGPGLTFSGSILRKV